MKVSETIINTFYIDTLSFWIGWFFGWANKPITNEDIKKQYRQETNFMLVQLQGTEPHLRAKFWREKKLTIYKGHIVEAFKEGYIKALC